LFLSFQLIQKLMDEAEGVKEKVLRLGFTATSALRALLLDRRAGYRAVGAIHAAIAGLGFQYGVAVRTFVEPLAGVGRHGFGLGETAYRAGDGRIRNNRAHVEPRGWDDG
jgi:hypothetical protein